MKTLDRHKKIGLALGGGAVLGAAHIGVLKALEEYNISIYAITGTSIGAFIAALYAFGKTWQEIEDIAIDLGWMDISAMSLSQYGLLANKKLGETLNDLLLGPVEFKNAGIPLAMIATDISHGEKVVLKEGDVAKAVMASTCIPGVFIPIDIENKLLVDGGILENVPLSPLQEMGTEIIIGVDLNAEHAYKKPENIIDVLVNTFDMALMNATKMQTEDADVLITPDLSAFNVLDTDQVADLIQQGYNEASDVLQECID